MTATMQQITTFAANNVPAEWSAIISASTFTPDFECDEIRIFKSERPVAFEMSADRVWQYGDTHDQVWASDIGYKGIDDKQVMSAKSIKIERGNRSMFIIIRRVFGQGYVARITVKQRG